MDANVESLEGQVWYTVTDGARRGPFAPRDLARMLQGGQVQPQTLVWAPGQMDWKPLAETPLASSLCLAQPPPVRGTQVRNTFVWFLALAPLIGDALEAVAANLLKANPLLAAQAYENGDYFLITMVLNSLLCWLDSRALRQGGWDTESFQGWFLLVPVYLHKRTRILGQSVAPVVVWWVSFLILVLG